MKWNAVLVCMAVLSLVLTNACGSNQQSEPSQGHAAIATTSASSEQLVNHVRYLASDELAGRAPGSRGEEMTLTYLTEQYVKMGYRPGNTDGSYVQAVPLVGFAVTNTPPLELESKQGRFDCRYGDDFMCWTLQRKTRVTVRNEQLVFVGYGIVAPEYDWDDYKDVDVRGKIIVMLVGDPPLPDTTQFGGRAMTYYGRWTYKFEIAAEKGAAGALIIHNTEAAGYPWEVVSNSWGGEQFDNERLNDGMDRCALEGWVTAGAGEEMFARLETTLSNAYEKALSRSFRPTPLAVTASVTMDMVFRKLRSYNVVARLEGRDPRLKNEYVIYTAHWDHLGKEIRSITARWTTPAAWPPHSRSRGYLPNTRANSNAPWCFSIRPQRRAVCLGRTITRKTPCIRSTEPSRRSTSTGQTSGGEQKTWWLSAMAFPISTTICKRLSSHRIDT
jgi:hypothetical protein